MHKKNKDQNNELAFVCYNYNNPPQYFKIKKRLLKLIVFTPAITITIISTLLALGVIYFNQIKDELKDSGLIKARMLEKKIAVFKEIIDDKNVLLKEFQEKLSLTDIQTKRIVSSVFKTPTGQKDLTALKNISLTNISVDISENRYISTFNISNNSSNGTKASGHIFVTFTTPSQFQIYPSNSFQHGINQTIFTKGESFWIMRSRPVKTIFNISTKIISTQIVIKVIIFSRTGDLLLKQQIYPEVKE